MGMSPRQKQNKTKTENISPPPTSKQNKTKHKYQNEKALTNIYRLFHSQITEYTFFLVSHKSVSKVGHILGHKANLNKFRKTEITACILPDHNRLKLGITEKEMP